MSTPPPLSLESTDRLIAVHAMADNAVDSGIAPDHAIAKAAAEYGLPAGHVPLVVQAFNTARAVRQLSEPEVWAKAANYPVASTEGILQLLSTPPAPTTKVAQDNSDYLFPPDHEIRHETITLSPTKRASSPPGEIKNDSKKESEKPKENRLSLQYAASSLFDKIATELKHASPKHYAAVRHLAHRFYPQTAEFVFQSLEQENSYAKKASAQPALTISVDHAALKWMGELDAIRQRYVPSTPIPPPEGYRKVASEFGVTLYQKLPTCPITGLPMGEKKANLHTEPLAQPPNPAATGAIRIPPIRPLAAAGPSIAGDAKMPVISSVSAAKAPVSSLPITKAPTPPKAAKEAGDLITTVVPTQTEFKAAAEGGKGDPAPPGFRESFTAGLGRGLSPMKYTYNNPLTRTALDTLRVAPPGQSSTESAISSATTGLTKGLARLDEQAAIQGILEDPRFHKADPRLVVQTYRDLSSIAPISMRNPSIAADYITRRLQTGPPSYYDLAQLVKIEKDLNMIQRSNVTSDDEED